MKPPRLSGSTLAAVRMAAETKGTDAAIREVMKRGLGIDKLFGLPEAWRGAVGLDARPLAAREPRRVEAAPSDPLPVRAWPHPAAAYAAAYRDRVTTPRRVAERALHEVERLAGLRPSMNIAAAQDRDATLRDADAAAARWAAGAPLGPFDGVPLLVKDEFDVAGLPTTLGVRCLPQPPAERDATLVARLRAAGAIFVCKTVLTEWGMSPLGNNVNFPMPHNAHDAARAPGGSSTGSAVGVALGVAPIATGGDGGGSIRIPAALNGVFGIKPTFGRVSRAGDGFKGSVAHAGPIASSTADLAAFLDVAAATPDPGDELTAWAPPPPAGGFGALLGAGVRGLRIGVDEGDWRDAAEPVAAGLPRGPARPRARGRRPRRHQPAHRAPRPPHRLPVHRPRVARRPSPRVARSARAPRRRPAPQLRRALRHDRARAPRRPAPPDRPPPRALQRARRRRRHRPAHHRDHRAPLRRGGREDLVQRSLPRSRGSCRLHLPRQPHRQPRRHRARRARRRPASPSASRSSATPGTR